jgi:hypothetical protein
LHDQTPSLESGIPAGWRTNILQTWEGWHFLLLFLKNLVDKIFLTCKIFIKITSLQLSVPKNPVQHQLNFQLQWQLIPGLVLREVIEKRDQGNLWFQKMLALECYQSIQKTGIYKPAMSV